MTLIGEISAVFMEKKDSPKNFFFSHYRLVRILTNRANPFIFPQRTTAWSTIRTLTVESNLEVTKNVGFVFLLENIFNTLQSFWTIRSLMQRLKWKPVHQTLAHICTIFLSNWCEKSYWHLRKCLSSKIAVLPNLYKFFSSFRSVRILHIEKNRCFVQKNSLA